ncbi:MAG: hypothetical protein DWQ01_19940 [Planctomycetota bacterium]|nr:MAG: hypothetical protein DWQ01_19940 [Planctomycetota bacterium]
MSAGWRKGKTARESRSIFAHLAGGWALVARKPQLLLLLAVAQFLLALVPALLVQNSAAEHLDALAGFQGEAELDFLGAVPQWLFEDWRRADRSLAASVQNSLAPMLLLSSLFGLCLSAGWMNLAVRGRSLRGIGPFFLGAGRFFFPFLRTWLLALGLYALVTWLVWYGPGQSLAQKWLPGGDFDHPTSENWVRRLQQSREGLYLLLIFLVELTVDLSRASLVVGHRRSALLSLVRGFGQLLSHPIRVVGLSLSGLAVEAALLLAATGWLLRRPEDLWLLVLLLPILRIAARAARQASLATLYAEWRLSTSPDTLENRDPFDDGTAWRTGADG